MNRPLMHYKIGEKKKGFIYVGIKKYARAWAVAMYTPESCGEVPEGNA
jgi:hypothetical protein